MGAQAVVTAVFLWFARRDTLVFSQVHILERTSRRYIRQIIKIGFPAGVQTMIYSGISMVLTRMVTDFGDTAIAVQKVGSQIESVAWMTAGRICSSHQFLYRAELRSRKDGAGQGRL